VSMMDVWALSEGFSYLDLMQKTRSLVFKKPRLDADNEQLKNRTKRLFGVLVGTLQERATEQKSSKVPSFFLFSFLLFRFRLFLLSQLTPPDPRSQEIKREEINQKLDEKVGGNLSSLHGRQL